MLIENIIGINLRADKNLIIWHIERDDKHGVTNLIFGDQTVNLTCTPGDESLSFQVKCFKEFELNIIWNDIIYTRIINPGLNIFKIE